MSHNRTVSYQVLHNAMVCQRVSSSSDIASGRRLVSHINISYHVIHTYKNIYRIVSCNATFNIMSYRTTLYIILCYITSYHIVSYYDISHHTISYHIKLY